MKIGYARVSTADQNLDLQVNALKEAGAERIFTDKGVSGAAVIKPAWNEALSIAREGDEIIVWHFDRLSRSLRDLIDELDRLGQLGIHLRSIKNQVDTTTPNGRFFFHIVGAFAEMERDLIRTRTLEGLAAARAAGKKLGRPPSITDDQWKEAKDLMAGDPPMPPVKVAKLLGVSRQAVHDRLRRERAAGEAAGAA